MLSKTLFDHFDHQFLLKPLLIMGRAMEYYGLRHGNDSDFIVPKPEFERLCEAFPDGQFTNVRGEKGVRSGTYEFYVDVFGFGYYELEREAVDEQDYLVVHLEFLLFLKTVTLIHEPENQKARQDMLLLMDKLGVLQLVLYDQPEKEGAQKNVSPPDGLFEDVKEITITELPLDIGVLLTQHGCTIFERGRDNILITFPAETQRQMIWPRTITERSRIMLSDGFELRHEIDRIQERSLLAIVLPS
jgi:hypothetical protein